MALYLYKGRGRGCLLGGFLLHLALARECVFGCTDSLCSHLRLSIAAAAAKEEDWSGMAGSPFDLFQPGCWRRAGKYGRAKTEFSLVSPEERLLRGFGSAGLSFLPFGEGMTHMGKGNRWIMGKAENN